MDSCFFDLGTLTLSPDTLTPLQYPYSLSSTLTALIRLLLSSTYSRSTLTPLVLLLSVPYSLSTLTPSPVYLLLSLQIRYSLSYSLSTLSLLSILLPLQYPYPSHSSPPVLIPYYLSITALVLTLSRYLTPSPSTLLSLSTLTPSQYPYSLSVRLLLVLTASPSVTLSPDTLTPSSTLTSSQGLTPLQYPYSSPERLLLSVPLLPLQYRYSLSRYAYPLQYPYSLITPLQWECPENVWFHVDKLSSAQVYVGLNPGQKIDDISKQRAASWETTKLFFLGNKKNNLDVVYTMWSDLKKSGYMDVGQVGFHSEKAVKRTSRAHQIFDSLEKKYEQFKKKFDWATEVKPEELERK
uniref:Coiled-coil domain-containing protein 25 n=1 Tax=Ditylenchus dipsaci TaxID=166011 RepID=A0A915DS96_9BILA